MDYYFAARVLGAFSTNGMTRSVYRYLGNLKTRRSTVIGNSKWVWEQKYSHSGSEGDVLELGTGWMHANSLYLALLANTRIHAFDVNDIRSLKSVHFQLDRMIKEINNDATIPEPLKRKAQERFEKCRLCNDFNHLYKQLNIEYSINESGIPDYPDSKFDLIYSCDVLEHVKKDNFGALAKVWRRMLKRNGRFIAQIGLDDHVTHYDKTRHLKQFLTHSKQFNENKLNSKLLYINRLSASEILSFLENAGFTILEDNRDYCDISTLNIHPDYKFQTMEDMRAVRMTIVAKPSD